MTNRSLLSLEGQNFSTYLSDLDNYSLTLRNDSTFLQKISSKSPFDFSSLTYTQSLLKSAFYARNDIKSYKLYLINQGLMFAIDRNSMQIKMSTFDYGNSDQSTAFKLSAQSPYYRCILPSEENDVFMIYYRTIINVSNQNPIAVIELSMNHDYVKSLSKTHENLNNCFCIFDESGQCFYTNRPDLILEMSPQLFLGRASGDHFYDTSAKGSQYLIVTEKTDGFYLVTLTPMDRIRESLNATRNMSFLLGLFAIILSMTLFTYFIKMITSPLTVLANHMKDAGQGDFSIKEDLTSSREMYLFTKRYHAMLTEIDELIKKNYIAKYNEEQAKLIALEAQVNPHFINNILQTIATEAIMNKQPKIYDMIVALASLQRYALKGPEMVSVESEMERVQQYLFLQKSRLGDALEYNMLAEESLLENLIPKLSIMTLVENSIIHGISGKKSSILISIKIYLYEENVYVETSDTGAGIAEAKLDEIREALKKEVIHSDPKRNIGLMNLSSRLKIIYDGKAKLLINSKENVGTTVILRIPAGLSETNESNP